MSGVGRCDGVCDLSGRSYVFCRYWKGLALPRMSTGTGRGDREEIGVPAETAAAPEIFRNLENRGDP